MTDEKARFLLTCWQEAMRTAQIQLDRVEEALGFLNPDSPFAKLADDLMGSLTEQAALATGADEGVLQAWWLEHSFGERAMEVQTNSGPWLHIKTIDDLAGLLLGDTDEGDDDEMPG